MRICFNVIAALSFLFSVIAIVSAQSDPLQSTACRFRLPGRIRIDCYTLGVPENRQNPDSPNIHLAIAILQHPSAAPEADPIIFLQGGPGGGTLDTLYLTYQGRFEPLLAANRDIILFDQRGTGRSNPRLGCPAYEINRLNTLDYELDGMDLSSREVDSILNNSLIFCGEALSGMNDLQGFNSVESAADIEAIRLAFGYEQVNLWGISYGTRLAMTAMRDFPQSFRRVVLDSVYPLEVNLFTELPANFDRALTVLFQACANDEVCNEVYPDLESVFYSTVDDLNRRPIRVDVPNPLAEEIQVYSDVVFNGDLMMDTVYQLLYISDALPSLPQLIYAASDRDVSAWRIIVGWFIGQRATFSIGMYYAVQCQEEFFFTEENAINDAWANYPNFATYRQTIRDVATLHNICRAFNAGEAPPTENMPIMSDIPTLLLSGEYDPITPPQWAANTHENFPNSLYFNLPASGHGVSGDVGCAQTLTIDFFTLDDITTLDSACINDIQMRFTGTQVGDFESPDSAVNSARNMIEYWKQGPTVGNDV